MKDKIRSPVIWDISHAVNPHNKGAVGGTTNTQFFTNNNISNASI